MFGEVGFDPADAGFRERMGQADLFAEHRFGARDALRTRGLAQADNDVARLLCGARPVDVRAGGGGVRLERFKVMAEIGDDMVLDRGGAGPRGVEIGEGVDGEGALRLGGAGGALDRELEIAVGERLVDAGGEGVGGAHASSPIAGPSPMPAMSSIA